MHMSSRVNMAHRQLQLCHQRGHPGAGGPRGSSPQQLSSSPAFSEFFLPWFPPPPPPHTQQAGMSSAGHMRLQALPIIWKQSSMSDEALWEGMWPHWPIVRESIAPPGMTALLGPCGQLDSGPRGKELGSGKGRVREPMLNAAKSSHWGLSSLLPPKLGTLYSTFLSL